MYPHDVLLLGRTLAVWDVVFLVAIAVGYAVVGSCMRAAGLARPRLLALRWLVTVYVSVLGAQLFAYAFDLHTTLLPARSVSWTAYYLNPISGPKTLYGAILALPLGIWAITAVGRDLDYREALNCWTPALLVVLALSRVGCFMQGCCHGVRSEFGVSFPVASPAYFQQLKGGLIEAGSAALPVIPTQAISALVLGGIAVWSYLQLRKRHSGVFLSAIILYSFFRLAIEFVRDDPGRNALGPLSTSQWIALALLGIVGTWKLASSPSPVGSASSHH